jgi:hypothetical protein
MSGLTTFFRDHLGGPCTIDDSNDDDYHKSLQYQYRQIDQNSTIYTSLVEYLEEPMDLLTCRTARVDFLQAYISNRILVNEDESEEESPSLLQPISPSKKKDDASFQDESPEVEGFETQQADTAQHHHYPMDDDDDADEDENNLVPHASATLHNVEYVSDMDLLTARATLLLCSVSKVWKCRSTKRNIHSFPCRRQPIYTSTPQFPRLAMDFMVDDGPLSSCYGHVLSLELRQFNTSILRQHVEQTMNRTITRQHHHDSSKHAQTNSSLRLSVFLYKNYAKAVQLLLTKCPKDCKPVVSFQNIPAKCIFPCAATDWLDRHDLANVCVVLGDESMMSVTTAIELEDGRTVEEECRVRFDEVDVILYVAFRNEPSGEFSSIYSITPDVTNGVAVLELAADENPFGEYYESVAQEETARNRSGVRLDHGREASAAPPAVDAPPAPDRTRRTTIPGRNGRQDHDAHGGSPAAALIYEAMVGVSLCGATMK